MRFIYLVGHLHMADYTEVSFMLPLYQCAKGQTFAFCSNFDAVTRQTTVGCWRGCTCQWASGNNSKTCCHDREHKPCWSLHNLNHMRRQSQRFKQWCGIHGQHWKMTDIHIQLYRNWKRWDQIEMVEIDSYKVSPKVSGWAIQGPAVDILFCNYEPKYRYLPSRRVVPPWTTFL